MSCYLIDGYNLFFRIEEVPNPLQHKREGFLDSLAHALEEANFSAIVIFDSHQNEAGIYPSTSVTHTGMEIIFSPFGQSADEYILEYLEAHRAAHELILVTDDRHLKLFAKETRVKTTTTKEFLIKLQKRAKKRKARDAPPTKPIRQSSKEFDRFLKIFEERFKS